MEEDDGLAYAALLIVGLIVIDGFTQDHYAAKRDNSLQSVYAGEKAFLNNQETDQTFSETAEDKFLKEKFLQLENKRKILEEKANEIRKAVEEHLDSLEKTIKAKNDALKKNMPTPQNAQAIVKGYLVKPHQSVMKQNVRA